MLGVQWECAQRGTRTRTSGGKQGCESTSTIARLFFFFSRLPRERALTASNSTRRERERERREERASGRGRVGSLGRHLFFLFFFLIDIRSRLTSGKRSSSPPTLHLELADVCVPFFFVCSLLRLSQSRPLFTPPHACARTWAKAALYSPGPRSHSCGLLSSRGARCQLESFLSLSLFLSSRPPASWAMAMAMATAMAVAPRLFSPLPSRTRALCVRNKIQGPAEWRSPFELRALAARRGGQVRNGKVPLSLSLSHRMPRACGLHFSWERRENKAEEQTSERTNAGGRCPRAKGAIRPTNGVTTERERDKVCILGN